MLSLVRARPLHHLPRAAAYFFPGGTLNQRVVTAMTAVVYK